MHFTAKMATVSAISSLLLLIFPAFTASKSIAESTVQSKRLVAKLIHRDSVLSPYYNSNETVVEQLQRSMKASAARLAYLYAQIERDIVYVNDHFLLSLLPSAYEPLFLVSFSMGQPPIPQLTIMDTGSSLLWVQCAPCKRCSQQTGPLLDPKKSSTYASLSCNHHLCHRAPRWRLQLVESMCLQTKLCKW